MLGGCALKYDCNRCWESTSINCTSVSISVGDTLGLVRIDILPVPSAQLHSSSLSTMCCVGSLSCKCSTWAINDCTLGSRSTVVGTGGTPPNPGPNKAYCSKPIVSSNSMGSWVSLSVSLTSRNASSIPLMLSPQSSWWSSTNFFCLTTLISVPANFAARLASLFRSAASVGNAWVVVSSAVVVWFAIWYPAWSGTHRAPSAH